MQFCWLFFLLLFISGSASATVLTATMTTTYFTVHYDPKDPYLAESAAQVASDELLRLAKDLGYEPEPQRRIPLMVYRTHHSFIKEGGHKDRYVVGTAHTGDERISVDASGAFVTMKTVISHELTHAVVFRILGRHVDALPLWMHEGLAKYQSEPYPDADDALVAQAAADGTLIALADLKKRFPGKRSDLAYAESSSAVRYMVHKYGSSAPKRLLAEIAKSGSFDKALFEATGVVEKEFVSQWAGSISKRYRLLRTWRILSALGGSTMAILAIIAFIIRRKRMARAAREWEWEEFEDSMSRQLRDWPHR
ncbi:MAG: hypothetical protein GX139_05245 [Armatimonadetes bacterium]|nr:hypothetical protein [Armatimonadota bacterium]